MDGESNKKICTGVFKNEERGEDCQPSRSHLRFRQYEIYEAVVILDKEETTRNIITLYFMKNTDFFKLLNAQKEAILTSMYPCHNLPSNSI